MFSFFFFLFFLGFASEMSKTTNFWYNNKKNWKKNTTVNKPTGIEKCHKVASVIEAKSNSVILLEVFFFFSFPLYFLLTKIEALSYLWDAGSNGPLCGIHTGQQNKVRGPFNSLAFGFEEVCSPRLLCTNIQARSINIAKGCSGR